MQIDLRRCVRNALLLLTFASAVPALAQSQPYPSKPVTLVVPFPPGAVTDRLGRAVAAELSKRLGQTIVVDNVGGASGTLAAQKVLRSTPDGYTLLLGTVNDMVLAPQVLRKAGYATKDFTPITRIGGAPTIIVAHPSFPANNSDELIAFAKRQSEPLPLGATGMGTLQTYGGILFANAAGFKFEVVPYKGGGPLITDLLGGQVQVATMALPSALQLVRTGKLKSLGVIAARRDPTAPELATVNEGKSVRGLEADLWAALAGPPNLPAPVVAKLSAAMRDVLADKAFRDAEARAGNVLAEYAEPQAFSQYLAREESRLRVLTANVTLD